MFFKNFKKLLILLTVFIMPTCVLAYSNYIIAGGENIGIHINSNGVMVVGTYDVNGSDIASISGVKVGDVITSINEQNVYTIDEMTQVIAHSDGVVRLGLIRDNQALTINLNMYKDSNNVFKTGLYVKDTVKGIGTLTFVDPNTKLFGALGHEILEKSTGKILEVKSGDIYNSTVVDIEPSRGGVPGEKNAVFDDESIGTIVENTKEGIFGNYLSDLPIKKLYKVGERDDVKKGSARILTVLNNNVVNEYDINILKIFDKEADTKNLLFEITDEELISKTGGIVQGMSGSPIIQGDYIIGAVTHVVVDDPTKGYGIFITNMLEEAEN